MAELNTFFYRSGCISPLDNQEKTVSYYIYKNTPCEDYSEIIKDDDRYFIRYNFSNYRPSILQWYPFKEDAHVLEINAEYGAITGMLCDRCKSVTATEPSIFKAGLICERYSSRINLTVYAANFTDIKFNKKFDYIIFFKTLEYEEKPAECLNLLKKLLKPDGVLLFEVENQYGIQYLAGQKESHSGIPFDSLADYPNGNLGRGFSRAGLLHVLEQSDFKAWRFYYPLPDYIASTAIYSDTGMPGINFIERLVISHNDTESFVANDAQLFVGAVENNIYPELSNHFLVEAADDSNVLTDIEYATITAYRSKEKAFATIIHQDIVEKKGLFKQSLDYEVYLCNLADELISRGIPVLPLKVVKGSVWMKYMKADTVQLYIRKLVKDGEHRKMEIFSVIDRLWAYILKSSEYSESYICNKPEYGKDIILKKAYLEMVTINSFWVNDDILFFDQEIVRENYPAKYILWRSFNMLYAQDHELDSIITRRDMLDRYEITADMEKLFIGFEEELEANENPYHYFCKDNISYAQMHYNRLKLAAGR